MRSQAPLVLLLFAACSSSAQQGPAQQSPTPGFTDDVVETEVIASGL